MEVKSKQSTIGQMIFFPGGIKSRGVVKARTYQIYSFWISSR